MNYIYCITNTINNKRYLAENWLIEHGCTKSKKAHIHITEVCKGKRLSMYKYLWKFYLEDPR